MEWSKLKSIIIVILLLLNAFLVVLVVQREGSELQHAEESKQQVIAILEKNGISFLPENLPADIPFAALEITRARDREDAMAVSLLGGAEKQDNVSGISASYLGDAGNADFFSTGKFSFTFSDDGLPLDGETVEVHAAQCLEKLGIAATLERVTQTEARTELTYCQTWNGIPVYSNRIVFSYGDHQLQGIDGTYLDGTPSQTGNSVSMSAATALVTFFAGINSGAISVCAEIQTMSSGYLVQTAQPNTLVPAWRIVTDTGEYYVNTETREITIIA
ncbi:MAG: hypothetical protein LUG13_02460 [Oscillospiraceae bacterium]|nr:hypothetical protein [Oscillospiraceae bacterium]